MKRLGRPSIILGLVIALTAMAGVVYAAQTWTATTAPLASWGGSASSADGTKLAAVSYTDAAGAAGYVYTSTDSGTTWATTTAPEAYWNGVASSADGAKLVAASECDPTCATYNGHVYVSADSGTTWATTTLPAAYWYDQPVASSADGTKLIAASECEAASAT